MDEMTADMIRVANIALSVLLLVACNMRLTRDWPKWTRRERGVRVHLTAYLFILAYGTAEVLAHSNAAPGVRVFMLLATHVSFALFLWRTRKDER